ncbi:MAG: prepilin peptidase [Armatimonadota bacterium]
MPIAGTKTVIMCAMLLIAAAMDVARGRIPNALTVPCALVGLALGAADAELAGLGASLAGIFAGLALWFVAPFIGNVLGGGDVKLLAAVGALQGPVFVLHTLALTAAWGGLLAVCCAAGRRKLLQCCRNLGRWLYLRSVWRSDVPLETAGGSPRLPFAVAIALGAVTALCVVS